MLRFLDLFLMSVAILLTFYWMNNNTHAIIISALIGVSSMIAYIRGWLND